MIVKLFSLLVLGLPAAAYTFDDAQKFLRNYCHSCHQGEKPSAGFHVAKLATLQTLLEEPRRWNRMLVRVREHEMPPKGAPAPDLKAREAFVDYVDNTMKTAACADGIAPLPSLTRRLNRAEYSATIRDLLNIPVSAGHALPPDGAGGEGFDNAGETLFLSPIHAEKFLDAAAEALHYGVKDPRSRVKFIAADPNSGLSHEEAAEKTLRQFLPRAFRRPVKADEVAAYMALYRTAYGRANSFEAAIVKTLQAAMISPHFLFKLEEANPGTGPRLLDGYALASRLSYFLWGSMPDEELTELAAAGKLRDPEVLGDQAIRLLRNERSREFSEQFVEQWLGIRELGRDIKPDQKLFPAYYNEEISSAMRYEPILFFQELLAKDLPLDNLIDSKFTFLTDKLQRHYEITLKDRLRQQPVRVELPAGTHRGGLLGMAAILAVSSYPNRTSPVLRGKWILENLLGTPPPPPPPNVPQLAAHDGKVPQTLRERLQLHRANPNCAGCHAKIDPLGFGLENFDVLGRWRSEDSGKPVDAAGELAGGAKFNGPEEMKAVLLRQKDVVIRNLAVKMLGYALGRGLTLEDHCSVDRIMEAVKVDQYRAQRLILEVVKSVPFRYQPGTAANQSAE